MAFEPFNLSNGTQANPHDLYDTGNEVLRYLHYQCRVQLQAQEVVPNRPIATITAPLDPQNTALPGTASLTHTHTHTHTHT
jgi:hypothetical protein